jgi:hypothetical protein
MKCDIKLHIIKKNDNSHNYYSKIFMNNIKNDNLKKIRTTTKLLETEEKYLPYISYEKNKIVYKLYDYYEVDKILDNVDDLYSKTNIVYNEMMESRL